MEDHNAGMKEELKSPVWYRETLEAVKK